MLFSSMILKCLPHGPCTGCSRSVDRLAGGPTYASLTAVSEGPGPTPLHSREREPDSENPAEECVGAVSAPDSTRDPLPVFLALVRRASW